MLYIYLSHQEFSFTQSFCVELFRSNFKGVEHRLEYVDTVDGVATQLQPIQKWWAYMMRIRHRFFTEKDFRFYYWIN